VYRRATLYILLLFESRTFGAYQKYSACIESLLTKNDESGHVSIGAILLRRLFSYSECLVLKNYFYFLNRELLDHITSIRHVLRVCWRKMMNLDMFLLEHRLFFCEVSYERKKTGSWCSSSNSSSSLSCDLLSDIICMNDIQVYLDRKIMDLNMFFSFWEKQLSVWSFFISSFPW